MNPPRSQKQSEQLRGYLAMVKMMQDPLGTDPIKDIDETCNRNRRKTDCVHQLALIKVIADGCYATRCVKCDKIVMTNSLDVLYPVDNDDEPDESMDGDHQSALASAGWGTDEDYGG